MKRTWSLPSGLAALLDALEQDLLAAPADEVRDAQHATGRARQAACQEVRSLLDDAVAAGEDGPTPRAAPEADIRASRLRH